MKKLILIRGLPGSGKTTRAYDICRILPTNNITVFEADQFFEGQHGYSWDRNFLSVAHNWCHDCTIKSLRDDNIAIVSNTFTRERELHKYFDLVKLFPDLVIEIIEMHTQYGSIHNIPVDTLTRMASDWETLTDLPPNVSITYVRPSTDQTITQVP